ncbi:cation transporting ATPase C-terminal domain-containing protein [Kitasatospora sp. NPDC018058]|uniref:cation transporting ATPase C-terminal domain-containing protein n=1 Tax=Kitasatospora sp. NPDC018058 TaxID=3364025 RepID=UPI0037BF989C
MTVSAQGLDTISGLTTAEAARFVLGLLRHHPPGGVTAISLAVAAVPESLPAVETLGSVTVLATDKTGTLTPGRMVVEPPHAPHQHILRSGVWQRVLLLGLVLAAAALGATIWARHGERPWQTVLFLALLAGQLGTVLSLRERLLTRAGLFLPAAVLASAALAAVALYLPFLRDVLDTVPLTWSDLAAPAVAGLAGFVAARLRKQGI